MSDYKIQGLDKLLSQFKNLQEIDVKESLLKGAYLIQRETQLNHDYINRTGNLQASPESSITEDGAQVEYKADYGFYVELKKPFIRPYIDEHSSDVIDLVREDIQKKINEEVE